MEYVVLWLITFLAWSWFFWVPGIVVFRSLKELEKPIATFSVCVAFCIFVFIVLVIANNFLVEYLNVQWQKKCLTNYEDHKNSCMNMFYIEHKSWILIWPISLVAGLAFAIFYVRKRTTNKFKNVITSYAGTDAAKTRRPF